MIGDVSSFIYLQHNEVKRTTFSGHEVEPIFLKVTVLEDVLSTSVPEDENFVVVISLGNF